MVVTKAETMEMGVETKEVETTEVETTEVETMAVETMAVETMEAETMVGEMELQHPVHLKGRGGLLPRRRTSSALTARRA